MTDEEIAVTLEAHKKEIGSLKHRMAGCEETLKDNQKLLRAVDKMTYSMEQMLKEQQAQGQRLSKLEQAPAEEYHYYRRLAFGCAITTVLGLILGALFTLLLR